MNCAVILGSVGGSVVMAAPPWQRFSGSEAGWPPGRVYDRDRWSKPFSESGGLGGAGQWGELCPQRKGPPEGTAAAGDADRRGAGEAADGLIVAALVAAGHAAR